MRVCFEWIGRLFQLFWKLLICQSLNVQPRELIICLKLRFELSQGGIDKRGIDFSF
jgi:hypothetical protein